MKIDEKIYRIIENVQDKLNIDYIREIYWRDKDEYKGYIEADTLLDMVEELMYALEQKEEEYERLEDDIDAYYNPKSPYEIYAIDEDQFH